MKKDIEIGDAILWMFFVASIIFTSIQSAFSQANPTDVLKVKIIGNGFSDETFIRFKENASISYESDNDSWKIFSMNQNVPMLYTKIDGSPVSLNTFPPLAKKVYIDLFTKIKNAGMYTIETKIISPFSGNPGLYLIDNISLDVYDLYQDTVLNIFLPADSGSIARFQLYFSTPSTVKPISLSCFKNKDGKIQIENLSIYGWLLNVVDENFVFNKNYSGNSESFEITDLHPGTYVLNINNLFDAAEVNSATVGTPMPVISLFEPSTDTVCLCDNNIVDFINVSPVGTNFTWDFGDGSKSDAQNPSHSYINAGNFIVSLVVSDNSCFDTSFKQIQVVDNFILWTELLQKEEGINIYFDGFSYLVNSTLFEAQLINIDVYNTLGQKIYSTKKVDVSKQDVHINPGKRMPPYIFSLYSEDKIISRMVF